jgi:phytoene synthase
MDTGRYARQKRIYLPHQLLKQFDLPAADILKAQATPALARLAAAQAELVREQVTAARAALSGPEKRRLRALLVYAALTLARLDEVARDGFRVTLHRVSLTPLRKLLIAWRSAYFPS